jgi:hypothetical protein
MVSSAFLLALVCKKFCTVIKGNARLKSLACTGWTEVDRRLRHHESQKQVRLGGFSISEDDAFPACGAGGASWYMDAGKGQGNMNHVSLDCPTCIMRWGMICVVSHACGRDVAPTWTLSSLALSASVRDMAQAF